VLVLAYQQIERALVTLLDTFDQNLIAVSLTHSGHTPFVFDPIEHALLDRGSC
jgi:hypothetical protein